MDNIISEEFIFLDINAKNKEDVISYMVERLLEKKIVKKEFYSKILEREANYPTGLKCGDINVAIPHADYKYVNKTAIAIGILKEPVKFNRMDLEEEIDVSIVMILAISDPNKHIKLLQRISELIQNQDILAELINANSRQKILNIFKNKLEEDVK